MPALIFDCDGVLADTERYGHLPAFNQMFARVRRSGAVVGRRVRRAAADRRRQGADGVGAHPGVRRSERPADRPGGAARTGRPLAPAQDRHLHRDGRRPAPCRPGRACAGSSRRPPRRLAARRRVDLGRAVRAVRARSTRSAPSWPSTSRVFAGDVVAAQETRSGHLPAGGQTSCGSDPADGVVVEDSRNGMLAALGAGLRLRRHDEQLHPRRGLHRRRAGRLQPRRPETPAGRVPAEVLRRSARRRIPDPFVDLADLRGRC